MKYLLTAIKHYFTVPEDMDDKTLLKIWEALTFAKDLKTLDGFHGLILSARLKPIPLLFSTPPMHLYIQTLELEVLLLKQSRESKFPKDKQ